ncbi:hypothetical protein O6H91_09G023500 [Diphasiastrum complanatum]|uniref:Uncharacterized protein n=1 Tax=Diphasiastrum complanatum TaxID=34168 RepID=A0ACC2CM30_DIPCM|nr:hypothetical protein O6H91_09G023500 [Diphasiastrum complanatum]
MGLEVLWAVVLGLAGVYFLISLQWNRQYKKAKGAPPGSMGWPLVGETLEFMITHASKDPDAFMEKHRAKYGNVFTSNLFGSPTIITADAEVSKFVLQNEGKYFRASYPKSFVDLLGKYSLLDIHGELHKRLHGLALSFVNSSKLKDYLMDDVERYVQSMLSTWQNRVVYVQEEAKLMTFSLIAKQLLSFPPGERTQSLKNEYYRFVAGFFSMRISLPGTTYSKAIQARQNIVRKLTVAINERKQDKITEYKDMLAALLDEKDANGESLTDDQIIDNVLGLLSAGHETTAMSMTLVVKYLTDCPKALQQLREEHQNLKKKKAGESLTWDDYKNIPFTQNVINETLRLANIALSVFREATQDIEIKGWKVMPYFRGLHLDPALYKDAKKFDPWRWEERIPSANFTPFGGGPRLCVGLELARIELSCFLHHLVTRFSWKPVEEDYVVAFPVTNMKKKLPIVVKLLNPDQ